jgi:hypothetical protein
MLQATAAGDMQAKEAGEQNGDLLPQAEETHMTWS